MVIKLLADINYYQDINSPPAVAQSTEPSLWERAFNQLSDKDKNTLSFPDANKNTFDSILEATRKSRDDCLARGVKFTFRGKDIIVRDVAEKLLTWVDKFKSIVDVAIQFDPVHAALPWAGVRFLLQVYCPLLNCRFNSNKEIDRCR